MLVCYVGLGSNLGDADEYLRRARLALAGLPGACLSAVSRAYLTEPWGDADQSWFANQAARLVFGQGWTPSGILQALLAIETALGRVRDPKRPYGPRSLDLDILYLEQGGRVGEGGLHPLSVCEKDLVVPHPRLYERAFALVPLAEVAPHLWPGDGQSVESALRGMGQKVHGQHISSVTKP